MKKEKMLLAFLPFILVIVLLGTPISTAKRPMSGQWLHRGKKFTPIMFLLIHLMEIVNEKCKTKDDKLEPKWVGGPETFKEQDLPMPVKLVVLISFTAPTYTILEEFPRVTTPHFRMAGVLNASEMWHAGIHDLADKAWQKEDIKVLSFQSFKFPFLLNKALHKVKRF